MRSFALLLDLQIKRTFREPPAAFFTLAFAPLFTLIMGLIFGNTPRPEFGGHGYLDANLASFAAIVVAISSFVLVPVDIITQRERGALRRFRATPLRPLTYLAADILVRFVAIVASTVLALLVGILGFGAHPTGGLSLMVAAIALGVLAFLALGYALTTVVPTSAAALALGNILVYPLIMLSGAAVPRAVMPANVRAIGQYSPLTQLVDLLQLAWTHGPAPQARLPLGVLVSILCIGTLIATRWFRWE